MRARLQAGTLERLLSAVSHERKAHGRSGHHRPGLCPARRRPGEDPRPHLRPKGTIEELTGHSLEDADLSKIVDGVKSQIADGSLDLGGIDLGAIAEKIDLGGIADNLGGVLGGLFGKK